MYKILEKTRFTEANLLSRKPLSAGTRPRAGHTWPYPRGEWQPGEIHMPAWLPLWRSGGEYRSFLRRTQVAGGHQRLSGWVPPKRRRSVHMYLYFQEIKGRNAIYHEDISLALFPKAESAGASWHFRLGYNVIECIMSVTKRFHVINAIS